MRCDVLSSHTSLLSPKESNFTTASCPNLSPFLTTPEAKKRTHFISFQTLHFTRTGTRILAGLTAVLTSFLKLSLHCGCSTCPLHFINAATFPSRRNLALIHK
jgi:hypothetical protein